jgi:uncharacterized protein (DUF2267 family)
MNDKAFVHQIAERCGCGERRAEVVIFSVFQELRDRLTPKEARDVAAQLPSSLKMLWAAFERPSREVARIHERRFLDDVAEMAAFDTDRQAETAVLAVFSALQQALGSPTGAEGEAWDVFSQLPSDLKRLWLSASEQT